ncbi:putative endo-beta-1,4-glucanase B [Colletotrichum aenigma]|uniref:putative endo-beta-1,4-glucanase B n=1 Tax=Colletotrichum aenigma TaxID=1215731 RepID=UPI001872ECCE|nr:putative endo-beta-1,4-glucanase B [Colletotrichum aenigma]KAF5525896.1 putative endo-beta-1,4-glucanase B [Colletotrichum aenigma]
MKFSNLALGAVSVASVLAAPVDGSAKTKRAGKFTFTGVNESGGEFGQANLPGQLGKDYTWPNKTAIDTLRAAGLNTFRIGTMMERIIPDKLTGTINETYFSGLEDLVKDVTSKGSYAVIDPHNYGRYYGNIITSSADFGAWWKTVAARFKDNEKVIFDTNNEYHDMDNTLVHDLNQAAITNIRAAGATTQNIWIEGNSYSGAWHWIESGSGDALKNLTDPSDATGKKLFYEMHQYLDTDGSGTNEACVSTTIGAERLAVATKWLKDNNKQGVLGEIGAGANDQCVTAVKGAIQHLSDNSDVWKGALWWAAGPWWADYMYSMEPTTGKAFVTYLPVLKTFA